MLPLTRPRGGSGSSAVHESQLIGSILTEDEDALRTERERERPVGDVKDPIGHRSTSAPPQLAMLDTQSQINETLLPNDLRLSPEYYMYYYSQRPLDPRLPPPIFNWSSWHYANSRRSGPGGGDKDFLIRAGLRLGDLAALEKEKASSALRDFPSASATPSMSPMLGSGVVNPLMQGIDEATADYILRSKGTLFSTASSASTSPHLQSLQSRPDLYEEERRELERRLTYGERDREAFGSSAISAEGAERRELTASLAPRLGTERRPETGSFADRSADSAFSRLDLSSRTGFERALSASIPSSTSGRLGGFGAQSASFSAGTTGGGSLSGFPPAVAQALFPSMGMPFAPVGGAGGIGGPRPPRPLGGLVSLAGQTARPTPGNLSTNPSPMMAVMGYGHLGHQPRPGGGAPETLSPSLAASLASLSLTERRPGPPQSSGPPIGSSIGSSVNGLPDFRSSPFAGSRGPGFGRRPPWEADKRGVEHPGFRGRPPRGLMAGGGPRHSVSGRGQQKGGRGRGAPGFGPPFPPPGVGISIPGVSVGVGVGPGGGPASAGGLDPGARSAWLDDFRLNKANSNLSLKDVVSRGLMLELATDQYGSRFIQQRLETATPDDKQAAFEQLLPETLRLCTDVFGNYVIQKFFEYGIFEHKKMLASKLVGNVLMLSLQMYGCRVVQKALDVSPDVETQALLVRELTGHVMECVKDQNGNHVIQKCIEKVPPYLIGFIVEAFSHQIFNLSTHPYGCRVIQRLLENCSESQRNAILSEILENVEDLCKNQYGNYVIQHVLIHGTPSHRGAIIRAVRGKILPLSKHKFASNVIEKCFAHASRQYRAVLVEEVLGKEDRDPAKTPLISMVKDQYANYVVQKMVDVVDEEQRAMILHRIKRHVPNLRKIPYGKHIVARIEKLTGKPIP